MARCRHYTWIVVLVAMAYVSTFIAETNASVGKFWHFTDPHADFSYLREGYSCRELHPDRSTIGDYNCDAPWSLVQNSIDAMKQIEPNVDFVIWTGDNVLHTLQAKEEDVLSTAINIEIIDNITNMLKTTFGDVPVYPAFGNHDYYPDAQVPPTPDTIYRHLHPGWYGLVRDGHFNTTFTKGGYYAVNLSDKLKLVSLNTILNYVRNKQVKNVPDPAEQFHWFESQLQDARATGRKVYAIAHIGMGVSKYGGSLSLYDEHHTRYLELMEEYSDVLAAMLFGHEHATFFKVFQDSNGVPKIPLLFAASVTPWIWDFKHNPAIGLLTYEKETGRILEMSQYYVDLPEAIRVGVLRWEKLYDFTTLYDTTDLSAMSIANLGNRLQNEALMRKYLRLSLVNATDIPCDQDCLNKYRCGILHLDMAGYERCLNLDSGSHRIGLNIGLTTGLLLTISAIVFTPVVGVIQFK